MAAVGAGAPQATDEHVHPHPHLHPDGGGPARRRSPGPSRALKATALASMATVTGYVYAADPDRGGSYPICPSKMLLGIDCPFCGGLRGTNALLHGRVTEALDHNVLLPGLLATIAVMLGLGALSLIGRPVRVPPVPRWLMVTVVVVLAAFTVTRNLPFDGVEYLASEA